MQAAVMVKDGTISKNHVCGSKMVVAFMVGLAFGKGLSDYAILDDEGSPYQIFQDEDEDEEDEEGDGDDDEEGAFTIYKQTKDGEGIKGMVFDKKNKAKKKFAKLKEKGRPCVLVDGEGTIMKSAIFEDLKLNRVTVFILGCMKGKGYSKTGGDAENEDSPLFSLESDE